MKKKHSIEFYSQTANTFNEAARALQILLAWDWPILKLHGSFHASSAVRSLTWPHPGQSEFCTFSLIKSILNNLNDLNDLNVDCSLSCQGWLFGAVSGCWAEAAARRPPPNLICWKDYGTKARALLLNIMMLHRGRRVCSKHWVLGSEAQNSSLLFVLALLGC